MFVCVPALLVIIHRYKRQYKDSSWFFVSKFGAVFVLLQLVHRIINAETGGTGTGTTGTHMARLMKRKNLWAQYLF